MSNRKPRPASSSPRIALRCLGGLLALGGCRQLAGIDDLSELDRLGRAERARCETNQQCIDWLGDYHVCRPSAAHCVSLLSEECTEVSGDYTSDSALLLGSIEPVTGDDSSAGLPIRWGIQLAVEDFEIASNGLPPLDHGTERRPIAVIHCNDRAENARSLRAAKHLADDVGVPAIVGAIFSGITLDVATQVTIPEGVLLISPSSTSAAISDLDDNGLVWRTAPSDVIQARAQIAVAARTERALRQERGLSEDTPLRLAVLHKGDAYGRGLAEEVITGLTWNGAPLLASANQSLFVRYDYGDPGLANTPSSAYEAAVSATLELTPDLVLLYGSSESVRDVLIPIEMRWPATSPRPHYLVADGTRLVELTAAVDKLDPHGKTRLANRVLGTQPGTFNKDYLLFRTRYASKADHPGDPISFGAANAYDALYMLAYSALVADKQHPTGTNLADGFAQLVPRKGRPEVHVGANSINTALRDLKQVGAINLEGASGPLDFDLSTGDAPSDMLLWCVGISKAGPSELVDYGEYYDNKTGKITAAGQLSPCGYP